MPVQLFTNNAKTLLDADINDSVTALAVTAAEGALFPSPTAGDWFYVTIESGSNREIVKVTTRVTDDFTVIERAQDGTSAQSWTAGATIQLRVSKAFLDTIHTTDSLPTAGIGDVTGPAGGVVDNEVCFFNSTTGKIIKGSGLLLSGSNTGDQVFSDATISTTDIVTNNATTAKHGFLPKLSNDATQFLNGVGGYSVPIMGTGQTEAIINGQFHLWQRGTSFVGHSVGYHADRFEHVEVSAGVFDVDRLTLGDSAIFTATGQLLNYGMRYEVTTADVSIAAGDTVFISHKIEGYRAIPYLHNEFTVSFFVRSNMSGAPNTFCFGARNDGPASVTDRSFVKEFDIDVADTWERKSIVVATQDRTGTWNYVEGNGVQLTWCLMSGTTFGSATDGVWNSTNEVATTNQVNWAGTIGNTFDITGIQIDLGPVAQPYRGVPIEQDLAAAQRYFQKSYDMGVDPAAISALGQVACIQNGTTHKEFIGFRTSMRAVPTVVAYNPTDGTAAQWEDVGVGGEAVTLVNPGMNGVTVAVTAGTDGLQLNGHYTAEAEL